MIATEAGVDSSTSSKPSVKRAGVSSFELNHPPRYANVEATAARATPISANLVSVLALPKLRRLPAGASESFDIFYSIARAVAICDPHISAIG